MEPFTIFEDNIPCIRIAEEPREHQRTKHIDIKYLFIRDMIKQKKLKVKYLCTQNQIADMFTKPLVKTKLIEFITKLGIKNEGKY